MTSTTKNKHLSLDDRKIIQQGIENGSTKKAIADVLGKDKSTIGKEIKAHRYATYKCPLPVECENYKTCKPNANHKTCSKQCPHFKQFTCSRRDRSPGACNGCKSARSCRYTHYRYDANIADNEYRDDLVNTRTGINSTCEEVKSLGEFLKPLIDQGQSFYAIKSNHPDKVPQCERTLYNYTEQGVFQNVGVSIKNIDLPRKVRRKMKKKDANAYKKRKDSSFLKGRTKVDYDNYMAENPNAHVVQMDTVYNDGSNGPFMQTFKFMKYDLLIIIYHTVKDSESMLKGILMLEEILSPQIFEKEVEVLLTDRGTEFVSAAEAELRSDGSTRCRVYYCDPMQSGQKGSLENIHELIRRICPKGYDLFALGLTSQDKANIISSHVNSYPKEKLDGKSSFQLLRFYNPDFFDRLQAFGITEISPDDVTLKPYILKQ